MPQDARKYRAAERIEQRDQCSTRAADATHWKPHLSLYAEKRLLTFKTPRDLERAIDLLWTDDLRALPHDTPDGNSIIVPAEAVAYFAQAGLHFTDERLRSISELSPREIKKLRRY